MTSHGNRNYRYPDFPRGNLNNREEAWTSLSNWVSSLIRLMEHKDSLDVFKVTFDSNKSIDIEGRVKVGDTDSGVTAQAGDIRYNTATNKHQGYNGSTWNDMY